MGQVRLVRAAGVVGGSGLTATLGPPRLAETDPALARTEATVLPTRPQRARLLPSRRRVAPA